MAYLARLGGVAEADMERTWNCGIGMVAIVAPQVADLALRSLSARGMKGWVCGKIERRTAESGSALVGANLELWDWHGGDRCPSSRRFSPPQPLGPRHEGLGLWEN